MKKCASIFVWLRSYFEFRIGNYVSQFVISSNVSTLSNSGDSKIAMVRLDLKSYLEMCQLLDCDQNYHGLKIESNHRASLEELREPWIILTKLIEAEST